MWGLGVNRLGGATLESRDKNILITTIFTRREWFERFKKGNTIIMGVTKSRDFGLSLEDLRALLWTLNKDV